MPLLKYINNLIAKLSQRKVLQSAEFGTFTQSEISEKRTTKQERWSNQSNIDEFCTSLASRLRFLKRN